MPPKSKANASKTPSKDAGTASEDEEFRNPFWNDVEAGGSALPPRSRSAERGSSTSQAQPPLASAQGQESIRTNPNETTGSNVDDQIAHQDQHLVTSLRQPLIKSASDSSGPTITLTADRSTAIRAASGPAATSARSHPPQPPVLQLPAGVQIESLIHQDGVYSFDIQTFQRFLDFEQEQRRRQHVEQQERLWWAQAGRELNEEARAAQQSQPRDSGLPTQAQSSLDREHCPHEIVTVSSSSDGEPSASAPRSEHSTARQEVITLHTPSPTRGTTGSETSDDIPLVHRSGNKSGSDGSNASTKSRSKVSWTDIQKGYSGHRCPVCGVTYAQPEEHNPLTCPNRNDHFNRSQEEYDWLDRFSALHRSWRRQNAQAPVPSGGSSANGVLEQAGSLNPSAPSTLQRRQSAQQTVDHAIREVRRDERAASRAGTRDLGGVRQDIRDAREDEAAERALSSDQDGSASASSSSWHPSTSESSLSSYHQSAQEMKQMRQELQQAIKDLQKQQEDFNRQRNEWQQIEMRRRQEAETSYGDRPTQWAAPPYMAQQPFHYMPMIPPAGWNGMPNQVYPFQAHPFPGQATYQDAFHQAPHSDWPQERWQPPWLHSQENYPSHDSSVPPYAARMPSEQGAGMSARPSLAPAHSAYPSHSQPSGFTPAANHIEHAGMSGAPEMALDQIGKVAEFQKHVRNYNAYALKAVSRNEPHLSLAQTMKKHAFAIATTFTTQILKRLRLAPHTYRPGDVTHYTEQSVMAMSDELFTRLYTESCSIDIEDPSQVYAILSSLEYVRQTPEEQSPMPALMRAEAAFRSKLCLLPQHAVTRCRPQELRDAFIRMVFTSANFETMKLDFQQCATWENVYQQLTYRASTASTWYNSAPTHKTTPEVSVTPSVSSSSPAAADKSAVKLHSKEQSDAYWRDELAKLQRSIKHDPIILEHVATDKKKAKLLQKLRYRQALESSIRDEVAKERQQREQRQQHSRERSQEYRQQHSRDGPRERSQERSFRPLGNDNHQRERDYQQVQHNRDFRPSRDNSRERGHYGGTLPRQPDTSTQYREDKPFQRGSGREQHGDSRTDNRPMSAPPSPSRAAPTSPRHADGQARDRHSSRSPSGHPGNK
jgi:hypothetical protein